MPFPSVACPGPQGEELHHGHTQQEEGDVESVPVGRGNPGPAPCQPCHPGRSTGPPRPSVSSFREWAYDGHILGILPGAGVLVPHRPRLHNGTMATAGLPVTAG